MPPRLRPTHNPEFLDALPPASSTRLDGTATRAITNQQRRLEQEVGNVNEAAIHNEEGRPDEPLYGYHFNVDGVDVQLTVDTSPAGEPTGEDREFVDARNRLAVLRSRERSRGSRRFNFAFMRDRGRGPGGHGYNSEGMDGIQAQYDVELSKFIARKVEAHPGLNNEERVTEAVSRAVIQEQKQMSTLERMAGEQKNGNRVLNFFRKHKKTRLAAGLALTGIAAIGAATGQLEIAVPALAARSALSAAGGYVLGRTGWDAFQGRRARRQPHEDIRMVDENNGDFSGRLRPRQAFERFVKINGAEARAGSHRPSRQDFAHRLGADLVHRYYTDELDFSHGHDENAIRHQVETLYGRVINPLDRRRLESDQTQSRRRHVAGLAGGVALGLLPMARAAELVGYPMFDIGGIGGGHEAAHHAASSHAHAAHGGNSGAASAEHTGGSASHNTSGSGSTTAGNHAGNTASHGGSVKSVESINGTSAPDLIRIPAGTGDITINGGPGNDTIILNAAHEGGAHAGHGAGSHHLHEALEAMAGNKLHVEPGGGFISTLEEQYNLSPTQADAAYHAMYHHLLGAPGTYMVGSDIRISAPGDFKLPHGAHAQLEAFLEKLHHGAGHHAHGHHNAAETADNGNGGTTAPANAASAHHPGAASGSAGNGGVAAPDNAIGVGPNDAVAGPTHTGGIAAPETHLSPIEAEQLAHHHDMPMPMHTDYTPETSLTPEQAHELKLAIGKFVHDGGFTGLGVKAGAAAEHALLQYVGTGEHPVDPAKAHQAMDTLHKLQLAFGHSLNQVLDSTEHTADSAKNAVTGAAAQTAAFAK